MKNVFQELDNIEVLSGTNSKKESLYKIFLLYPESEAYFRLVYDDTIYGVSTRSFEKIIDYDKEKDGTYFDAGELIASFIRKKRMGGVHVPAWMELCIFLKALAEKSGNEQLEYLKKNILSYDYLAAKWITRLILKDLKLGVSLITINKVLEKLGKEKIKKFEVQLCGLINSINDTKEIYEKVGFPAIACVKYDGERGFLSKQGNKVTFTSRNGKIIDYVPELIEAFSKIDTNFILDGEILCSDFSSLQKRIGRKLENIEAIENLHFRVFDVLSWSNMDFIEETQAERTKFINEAIKESEFLKIEEHVIVYNIKELEEFYNKIVARKEEGIILKSISKRYDFGSRKNWYKIKPIREASFKILQKKYGTGKKASMISSVLITDKSEQISSWVGSGLTDNDILILMNLDRENKLKDTILDIAYNEITKDKHGRYSLRFPRVLKIRLDKNEADDLSTNLVDTSRY